MARLLSYYQVYNFGGLDMMDIIISSTPVLTPVLLFIGWLFYYSSKSDEKKDKLKYKSANKQVKANKIKKNDGSESFIATAIVLPSSSCKTEESYNSCDSSSSDSGGCD